ncbi:MAG: G5 domain-containing protein [Eubacteriales bacterium]|nr:G5 domain-containing protein [Eubacteriales bacterium]
MKTRKLSRKQVLKRTLLPLYRLLDYFLRLKTSRIVWRLLTLTSLVLFMSVGSFLAYIEQPSLVDQDKIPALIRIAQPEQTVEWLTYSDQVMQAVDEAGIVVGKNDLLSLPADQNLIPGQSYDLTITRRGEFTFLWSGLAVNAVSEPIESVDLMARSGFDLIDLSDGSRVEQPTADTLAYIAVDKKEFRISEVIAYSIAYENDPELEVGKTAIATPGQNGSRDLIFEDTYENGIFISREQVGTEVMLEPVQEVIHKGTKVIIKAIDRRKVGATVLNSFDQIKPLLKPNGRLNYNSFTDNGDGTLTVDGKSFSYTSVMRRRITMFDGLEVCIHAGDHNPPINHNTSSGVPAQRGLVATYGNRIDGKVYPTLPMGTIVFIENYGLGVIADIHGVSSNKDLLDACYDPGELMSGAFPVFSAYRDTYIIYTPQ